jgi:hypothetical protein
LSRSAMSNTSMWSVGISEDRITGLVVIERVASVGDKGRQRICSSL